MKSKLYKNPEAPFSLGLTYLCPSCKTEIVENENKILNTSRTYIKDILQLIATFSVFIWYCIYYEAKLEQR